MNAWPPISISRLSGFSSFVAMCNPAASALLSGTRTELGDLPFKVTGLVAGNQADSPERHEMLLRFRWISDHQVGLHNVLVRAAVARVELHLAVLVLECRRDLARLS